MLSPFTVPALEGTAGPVTLNDPVFISDLHLSHSEPDTINAFLRFLEHEAAEHAELLILGDFFDYWIGDDASYTMAAVADALRAYSASHGLYIMHGNRDFMMGERFAREIGATLLRDPAVGVLRGERILLSHGDLWCTFDADYQKVRRRVRSVWWQWIMLRLPLKKRLQVAEDARARSRTRKSVKAAYITDVDERALDEAARNLEAAVVIHGHTHRPGITTTAGGVTRAVYPTGTSGGELHPRRLDRHRGQSPRSTPHEVTALTERPTAQAFLCTPIAQTAHGS
ncbi:MAG: UDP-2,3-diacylglucosamine diphosphatase [Sutterella wadsworthensis]